MARPHSFLQRFITSAFWPGSRDEIVARCQVCGRSRIYMPAGHENIGEPVYLVDGKRVCRKCYSEQQFDKWWKPKVVQG